MHTKIFKVLMLFSLFMLFLLPAHAWTYNSGNRVYCGYDGCYGIDNVKPIRYQTVIGDGYRYKYYNGPKNVDIDIDIDIDYNDDYDRYSRYASPYYYGNSNVRYIRGAEYTYPYNHRVVRQGYPYYTTNRYSYW